MTNGIAVINAGSSSVKFAVYGATSEAPISLRGQIDGIGVAPRLKIADAQSNVVGSEAWPAQGFDHAQAMHEILVRVRALIPGTAVVGIGHRVVHGGMHYD